MKASEIVEQALKHMQDRASTYDCPDGERSIGATVKAFKAITGDGLITTEERGWLFMLLLKAVRSQQGEYRADSYEDGAAYFALAGEAAFNERAAGKAKPAPTSGIDWDKAPHGATHYCPETASCYAYWISFQPGNPTHSRLVVDGNPNSKWYTSYKPLTEEKLKACIARPSV